MTALALAALIAPSSARADDPADLRSEVEQLRAETRGLEVQAQEALLELYALESDLARAERRLDALLDRQATIEAQVEAAQRRLELARADAEEAERRLASRLQTLYVHGEVDPLAVLLGAESLDEALSALDGLGRVARQDGSILRQVREARTEVRRAVRTLSERRAQVRALVGEASAEREALAVARSARSAYLADLSRRSELAGAALERLTARAAAAEEKAAAVPVSGSSASTAGGNSAPAPTAAPAPTSAGSTMTVSSTGYCLRGTTATGVPVGWGVVAVDPAVIPLGTRMSIPGYGEGVAADTGSAVRGAKIDLWFPRCSQALAWGHRTITITLL